MFQIAIKMLIVIILLIFSLWYIVKMKYEEWMELDPTILRLKNKLLPTFPELNGIKLMKSTSSYTINKHKVYICTEYGDEQYDDNMLTYVILHELAHVKNKDVGHGPTFFKEFNLLLEKATRAKLYDPSIPRIENYCK